MIVNRWTLVTAKKKSKINYYVTRTLIIHKIHSLVWVKEAILKLTSIWPKQGSNLIEQVHSAAHKLISTWPRQGSNLIKQVLLAATRLVTNHVCHSTWPKTKVKWTQQATNHKSHSTWRRLKTSSATLKAPWATSTSTWLKHKTKWITHQTSLVCKLKPVRAQSLRTQRRNKPRSNWKWKMVKSRN